MARSPKSASLRTWLVTGGGGFLGRTLVGRLVRDGRRVRILDAAPPGSWPERPPGVEYVCGDIRDAAVVDRAVAGADVIVHAAAALPIVRKRKQIWDVNVNGTRHLIEAAFRHGVKAFVFTSSTAVYGLPKVHPIQETSPMIPVGPYGESKVEAERLLREARAKGLHVAILRAKTFIGPGRLGVFEILFDWIRRGKRIYLIGKGHNKYQLLDVEDLCEAIVLSATRSEGNDDFNLGADRFGTLREDLAALFEVARSGARFRSLPKRTTISILWTLDQLRLSPLSRWHYGTMATDSYVDTTKARTVLGWTPKRSNQEAMIAAYRWYVDHLGEFRGRTGTSHTVPWRQGILRLLRRVS